jgi:hypothetical protein
MASLHRVTLRYSSLSAHQELPANTGPTKGQTYRFSWFQSALAAAGAVAVVALVLLSAIVIGMYDPPGGPDVVSVDTAGDSWRCCDRLTTR